MKNKNKIFFLNNQYNSGQMFDPFCYQPHQEKHIHQSPEGGAWCNADAEGAEYNDLEEDNVFETESETSNKKADNYKCSFCQKINIDKT